MATCSITDTFVIDADTFYVAVNISKDAATEKMTEPTASQESSIKIEVLKSDDIKMVFGNVTNQRC